jgi:bifunctional UDP-N-acetylglucosamine pyrophosphorylase/glucosamine-1-phosphate N-acetyltransferase
LRAAIILAAGHGKRMRSSLPKVLHPVLGRPMVLRVADTALQAGLDRIVVVVGHGRELVTPLLLENGHGWAVQEEQLGTAHALRCGLEALDGEEAEEVCVLLGDVPLIRTETVESLLRTRRETSSAVTVLTTVLEDPSGYGRIVRSAGGGDVTAIVEDRDALPEQRSIREINTGLMAFDGGELPGIIRRVGSDNSQGEYYLTDAVSIAVGDGLRVTASVAEDSIEVAGVNNPVQLAACTEALRRRVVQRHLSQGVVIPDPPTVWIEEDVRIGPGSFIGRLCRLSSGASIGRGCSVGDGAVLSGVELPDGSTVEPFTVMEA